MPLKKHLKYIIVTTNSMPLKKHLKYIIAKINSMPLKKSILAFCMMMCIITLSACSTVPKSKVAIPGFESQTPRGKSNTQTQGIDLGAEDAYDDIEEVVAKNTRRSKNNNQEQDATGSLEEILLLEIQVSRGEDIMPIIDAMITYAEKYNNEEVAERAYELSTQIYDQSIAKDIARRWHALSASSDAAQKSYIQQLLISSDYQLAFEIMARRVDQGRSADFLSIASNYQVIDQKQAENLITTYNRYIRTYPDQRTNLNAGIMLARFKLAHFLFYQQEYDESLSLLNLILSSRQEIQGLNIAQQASEIKTRIYYLSDNPNAEVFYRQATRRYPKSYPINVYYALHLLRQDKARQAERFLVNWSKKNLSPSDSINKLLTLGIAAHKLSLDDLYEYASDAIAKHPDEDRVNFLTGTLAFEIGDVTGAESMLSRIGNTSPLWISAATMRLKNAVRANDFGAAEDLLKEVSFQNKRVYIYLTDKYATELIYKDLTKKAKEVVVKMSKELGDDIEVLETTAFIYYKMGDTSAMSRAFDKALRKEPDNHSIKNSFGYSLADKDIQLNKARRLINDAIEQNPTSVAYVDSLGWLNYRRGNLQEAKYLLEWAYRRKIDPEIAAHMGEVLWQSGQQQRATYLWLLNSDIHPNAKVLHDTLDRYSIDRSFLDNNSYFFKDPSFE